MFTAEVKLWNIPVGVVLFDDNNNKTTFEFYDHFISQDLDIAPLTMPLEQLKRGDKIYSFPNLNENTYHNLPGLLSDSLPDRFGNSIINNYLAKQGRPADYFNPVERLCYTGKRAIGALEFFPVLLADNISQHLEINNLVSVVNELMDKKARLGTNIKNEKAIDDILFVGTSAGGARAKAIVGYNKLTGDIKPGIVDLPEGYRHCIIKLDGVQEGTITDGMRYGKIEYAYHKMALDCKIDMTTSMLIHENNRAHFITERFDRDGNNKIHAQSLCALAHYDYNDPLSYSYEQAFTVLRRMNMDYHDKEQLFRRMVFNVIAVNNDDHTKNISFLMDKTGKWRLSPAYDMTYAYASEGSWTSQHQMSVNGKRKNITSEDLIKIGNDNNINNPVHIIEHSVETITNWNDYARDAGIEKEKAKKISNILNLDIMSSKKNNPKNLNR